MNTLYVTTEKKNDICSIVVPQLANYEIQIFLLCSKQPATESYPVAD
jgi:hypothetical protein